MIYGDFKDLPRKKALVEVLISKAFNIAEYNGCQKYDGYQKGLASMIYNFFDK